MRPNQILVGIIILLIGAFSLLRNFLSFNFGAFTILALGLVLILLYRQKKAVWALFLGGYLTCFGLIGLLTWLGIGVGGMRIFASMFFIVPGIIFMVLCYDKNKRGLFVPACVMLLLGGYFMLGSFIGMGWIFRLAGGATRFAPYALIAVGVIIIIRSMSRKR